MVKFHRPTQVV